MSRTVTFILLGISAMILVGAMIVATFFIGRSVLNAAEDGPVGTAVVDITPAITATPTVTATATLTNSNSTPVATPAATVAATASQSAGCTDAATFVADVTIPDGSQVAPGATFVKTWRLKNSGTCTWDGRYKLVFASGNTLGALANSFALETTVAPGELVDLSVTLVAPTTPATYEGNWKLQNPQSQVFGIGANRAGAFWVKMTVANNTQGSGSISGFTWRDNDRDNVVDSDEKVPGLTVTLAAGTECKTILATTTADANGRFTFTKLAANTYCLFGSDGTTTVSQSGPILAANQQLTDVYLTWPPAWQPETVITGLVYQDINQNGIYDNGEQLMGNQQIWLMPGTACQVKQDPIALNFTGADGRYTLAGEFSGSYCVGLAGSNGLDDVIGISVISGQSLSNINLKAPVPYGSISGFVWNDFCLTNENGDALQGNCVADGNGDYHADGMIQPTETNIAGVTIFMQLGSCQNNTAVKVSAVTDATGKYLFNNLGPGTYCISMDASAQGNAALLLPGDWTFPARGIWYQELTLLGNDNAYSVNFGWDYQLK